MEDSKLPTVTKLPLTLALQQVAQLFDALDNGELSLVAIDELIKSAGLTLADSVDRRIALVQIIAGGRFSRKPIKDKDGKVVANEWLGLIGSAKEAMETWGIRYHVLCDTLDRIKQTTIEALSDSPYDAVTGDDGSFKLRNNPPSLEVTAPGFTLGETITIRNVISPDHMEFYNLPAKYTIQTITHSIDTERLKADLTAGEAAWKWAKLTSKKGLTITMKKGDL